MRKQVKEVFEKTKAILIFENYVSDINAQIKKKNRTIRQKLLYTCESAVTPMQHETARNKLEEHKPRRGHIPASVVTTFSAITKVFFRHFSENATLSFKTTYESLATVSGSSAKTVKRNLDLPLLKKYFEVKRAFRGIRITLIKENPAFVFSKRTNTKTPGFRKEQVPQKSSPPQRFEEKKASEQSLKQHVANQFGTQHKQPQPLANQVPCSGENAAKLPGNKPQIIDYATKICFGILAKQGFA